MVVVFSLGLFLAYHFWLLFLRGRGTKVPQRLALTDCAAAAAQLPSQNT